MASISPTLANRLGRPGRGSTNGFITFSNAAQSAEANSSGVLWVAVVAVAVVAAELSLSLALLLPGTGLGLSIVSLDR